MEKLEQRKRGYTYLAAVCLIGFAISAVFTSFQDDPNWFPAFIFIIQFVLFIGEAGELRLEQQIKRLTKRVKKLERR